MLILKNRKINITSLFRLLIIFLAILLMCSCEKDDGDESVPELNLTTNSGWDRLLITQVETRGLVSPYVKAEKDSNDFLHFAYFEGDIPEEDSTNPDFYEDDRYFYIKHNTWDMHSLEVGEEEVVVEGLDNCLGLDLSLDQNNAPIVAYQGGLVKECGAANQADAMFSVAQADSTWQEYTGASGDVDRNPVFFDGYAGTNISIAVDAIGDIHMSYQFRWEGCDSYNFMYPDLRYIAKSSSGLNVDVNEEPVEGNIYVNNGTGMQNDAGGYNDLLMDNNDEPIIFYYAHLPPSHTESGQYVQGLRVARKLAGQWEYEWIETGIEIGDISGAIDNDGNLAVAYYVTNYIDDEDAYNHCLKYAQLVSGTWEVSVVEEATLCGNYCSLAFNSLGDPAIAYYALMSRSGRDLKDLKLARFSSGVWETGQVEERGDVGLYNSLFFDDNNRVIISTYSHSDKSIYVYFQQ